VSNTRYYARRDAGLCPDCPNAVSAGTYCGDCRIRRMGRIRRDRADDRAGYNQYMRVYKQHRRELAQVGSDAARAGLRDGHVGGSRERTDL
jgi:hypothetical protein